MNLIYSKVPSLYKDFKKIWRENLFDPCGLCHSVLQTDGLPFWWAVCSHCARIYILHPKKCLLFPGWDSKKCCNPCHGYNYHFEDCCKVYKLIDGRFINACCSAAKWLKEIKLLQDDPGWGDEEVFEYAHDPNHQPE